MNLQGLVNHLHSHMRGVEFGHCGQFCIGPSLVQQPCRLVDHIAGTLNFGGHFRDFELGGLKGAYGFAKLSSLPGLPDCHIHGSLSQS